MVSATELAYFETTLEACYRVEQSRRGWLRGVVGSLDWLYRDRGVFGFTYTIDAEERVLVDEVVASDGRGVVQEALLLTAQKERTLIELAHMTQDAAAIGRLPVVSESATASLGHGHSHLDSWFIHGRNPDLLNVLIVVDRLSSGLAPDHTAELLARLVVHIAAGARLQRQLELHQAHSTPAEREPAFRRGKLAPLFGKAACNVVDQFEVNGRHYLLACEPAPKSYGTQALSAREREVLAFAATGSSNKEIAFELGISHSTVRVLLARAAKKLRADDRQGAVQHFTRNNA